MALECVLDASLRRRITTGLWSCSSATLACPRRQAHREHFTRARSTHPHTRTRVTSCRSACSSSPARVVLGAGFQCPRTVAVQATPTRKNSWRCAAGASRPWQGLLKAHRHRERMRPPSSILPPLWSLAEQTPAKWAGGAPTRDPLRPGVSEPYQQLVGGLRPRWRRTSWMVCGRDRKIVLPRDPVVQSPECHALRRDGPQI